MNNNIIPIIFKEYFFNQKYDDYPVVGVSYRHAKFYCIWRTNKESKEREEKGLPRIHAYRLPLESEWKYVALLADSIQQNESENQILLTNGEILFKSNSGYKNTWNVMNMNNNVSEWLGTVNGEPVYLGGSWSDSVIKESEMFKDDKSGSLSIGFRIVTSYISGEK